MKYERIEDLLKDPNWKEILREKNVKVFPRDPYYVLDYIQGAVDWADPIPRQCRGLFIHQADLTVASRAYDKFFNIEEPFAVEIDDATNVTHIQVVEKLDGSLVRAYWSEYFEKWVWGTNSGVDATKVDIKNPSGNIRTFADVIYKALGLSEIEFQSRALRYLDKRYTYVYELCSEHQPIVVLYPGTFLYFHGKIHNILATQHKTALEGLTLSPLVQEPLQFAYVPYSYTQDIGVTDWYELNIRPIINRINAGRHFPTCEGTIIRALNGEFVVGMIKVKQPEYVESHYLGSYDIKKNILEAITKGEELEFESVVLKAYPHFKAQYDFIRGNIDNKIEELSEEYFQARSMYDEYRGDRKGFAQLTNTIAKPINRWIYFDVFDEKEINIKQYVLENYDKLFKEQ